MVASPFMRVMEQKVVVTLSIYTVEDSNENQGLLMDIRKKDMINNITINKTFMMLEPLKSSPAMCVIDCQLISSDGQLISSDGQLIVCDGQLIACDGQLITVYSNSTASVFQQIISLMAGLRGKPSPAASGRCRWPAPPQWKVKPSPEKLQFFNLPTVHYALYRGCHSHLGLKS